MKKVSKFVYWTPRIVSLFFIAFLVLFSFDVFGEGYGFWLTALAFLMHNIPAIILAFILLIAWKREIVGAWTFFIAGILYIAQMTYNALTNPAEWYMLSYSIIIAGPAFFIAALFYIGWKRKNR